MTVTKRRYPRRGEIDAFLAMAAAAPHGVDDPCVLWPFTIGTQGYGQVHRGGRTRGAHALVLEMRDGLAPDGCEASHYPGHSARDGLRHCVNHVAWASSRGNSAVALADGTTLRGVEIRQSKLTEKQVLEIVASDEGHRALAARFGVSHPTITAIRSGKTWSWLTGL